MIVFAKKDSFLQIRTNFADSVLILRQAISVILYCSRAPRVTNADSRHGLLCLSPLIGIKTHKAFGVKVQDFKLKRMITNQF